MAFWLLVRIPGSPTLEASLMDDMFLFTVKSKLIALSESSLADCATLWTGFFSYLNINSLSVHLEATSVNFMITVKCRRVLSVAETGLAD